MATDSWSSRVRHDSDATWQEWRDELVAKLNSIDGLAADETNITPGSGARPGTNTEGGYAVYHLDDDLHSVAPIYLRFGFGTGTQGTAPRIQVTVGTSTDGNGTLGGVVSTAGTITSNATLTVDTSRTSYLSVNEGFFGLMWKVGSASDGAFLVCRTCDAAGTPDATGALAHWGAVSSFTITRRQAYRYASPAQAFPALSSVTSGMLGFSPQALPSTAVDGDVQVMLGWTVTPRVSPLFGICGVYASEIAPGSTFTAALVGVTPRTYIVLPNTAGPFSAVSSGDGYLNMAMLWE